MLLQRRCFCSDVANPRYRVKQYDITANVAIEPATFLSTQLRSLRSTFAHGAYIVAEQRLSSLCSSDFQPIARAEITVLNSEFDRKACQYNRVLADFFLFLKKKRKNKMCD